MDSANPLEYAPLETFPLKWRFAEDPDRWTVLPDEDLRHFRPLTEISARVQWNQLVTPTADHLMAVGASRLRFKSSLADFRVADDWNAAEEARRVAEFLRAHVPIHDSDGLIFFWNASVAVETTWDIVLRYWSDFCYPSDDSNVVVPFEGDRLVVHVESHVWVFALHENS